MNHIKKFNEESDNSQSNSHMTQLEDKIIELLDEAGEKLSKNDFEILAESIMDYIDEIARSKK